MSSWHSTAWRISSLVVGVVMVAGCKVAVPEHQPLPTSSVSFDGGATPFDMPPLSGNVLPLDGGADGGPTTFGALAFTVRDYDTRAPMPARVIFRPPPGAGFSDSITSGTPDIMGANAARGAVVGPGVLGVQEGVMLQGGIGVVPVPPGVYDLNINRGPEWEAIDVHVKVEAGKTQAVHAILERSVDTRGWLAADMHVHMQTSFDSTVPTDRRVISMATSGIELMVTTDHHNIVDTLPLVRALGYGPEAMTALSGDELNFNEGHAGLYPVVYDATLPYGGSPPWQPYSGRPGRCSQPWVGTNCYSDVDAFPLMHSLYPDSVVTVNHPWWSGGDLGYFTNIDWGAGTNNPLPSPLRSAGLFDAMEILNGYWTRANAEQALLSDWFYLISEGYRVTALGSSDTHRINWVRAGWPRSWIRLPSEKPGDVTPGDFASAIKNGRVVASTGPFLTLNVDGGEIGDVVRPKQKGSVTVDITADAPDWMPLDTVQLFVDGVAYAKWNVPKSGLRPQFTTTLTVPVTTDTWMVAIVGGKQPLPPDLVGEYSHSNGYEMLPWAVTNPVFVDHNGDGWHPVKTWRGAPVLDSQDFGWRGVPMPATPDPANVPLAARRARFEGVPVDCDPGNKQPFDTEPPLDSMQMALPLLYP